MATKFARRHYEEVATILQELYPNLPKDGDGNYDADDYEDEALGRQLMWDDMVSSFAATFKIDNPNFNRSLFLEWCRDVKDVE